MSMKGIRISDVREGKCIPLSELLTSVPDATSLHWGLLWLDASSVKGEGQNINDLGRQVNQSENGLILDFDFLFDIARKIYQEIDVLIIGCLDPRDLRRYKEDKEMYESCDVVLEMIDGGFWEVFSKNASWLEGLSRKYKNIEILCQED